MEREKILFTSESVTEGHPDKMCDQISDAILDELMRQDPMSRVACETCCTTGLVMVMGEITTKAYVDIQKIVRDTVREIGYTRGKYGFDADTCGVITTLDEQSADIAMGVDKALEAKEGNAAEEETGAGDQGMMFGYATNETKELMPLPILLANKITQKLSEARKKDKNSILLPDGKSQITVEYEDDIPKRIDTIIVSSSHKKDVSLNTLKKYIKEEIIKKVIPKNYLDSNTVIMINTGGTFTLGGSFADSGTTGRKIVVDTYGGSAKVGGGCFSSKDPSKVDRSGAYYARYVAKNIVYNKLCDRCEVSVAYAIGKEQPIHINIETFNTNKVPIKKIYDFVDQHFNFNVDNIIKELDLYNIEYYKLAIYGHFGRNELNLPWEKTKEFID